jgi:nucleoside-triphosphatase
MEPGASKPPRVFVTGPPASGKSTLALGVIEAARALGVRVAGISTPEQRAGARTGFEIVDLASGMRRVMASIGRHDGPHVGRYGLDLAAIEAVVARFLESLPGAGLVVLDEIGRMELSSPRFLPAVEEAFASPAPLFAVVHRSLAADFAPRGTLLHLASPGAIAIAEVVRRLGLAS